MRTTAIGATLATSLALAGMAQDDNLLKNPGFEDASSQAWSFANHGQDFVRGEIQAQNYHGGLKAASVTVAEQPRVYASWLQDVKLGQDELAPDELSLWYTAPDNNFEVCRRSGELHGGEVHQLAPGPPSSSHPNQKPSSCAWSCA